ncbi:hypothetical protein E2C01_073638 [Portunus trituberculatus]|uniref:Uncharacterized protein n=1 Tax=Portunus trituberculatus TaxID=210409 RepID=A0A5B7IA93_PORTR|nr:hypothetical protein [Portunus trituberculatus]
MLCATRADAARPPRESRHQRAPLSTVTLILWRRYSSWLPLVLSHRGFGPDDWTLQVAPPQAAMLRRGHYGAVGAYLLFPLPL